MHKKPVVSLARRVIGPLFSGFTALSWSDRISSMELIPATKLRVPRVAKPKLPHNINEEGRCVACGKKPRKPAALCPGPAKTETEIVDSLTV